MHVAPGNPANLRAPKAKSIPTMDPSRTPTHSPALAAQPDPAPEAPANTPRRAT